MPQKLNVSDFVVVQRYDDSIRWFKKVFIVSSLFFSSLQLILHQISHDQICHIGHLSNWTSHINSGAIFVFSFMIISSICKITQTIRSDQNFRGKSAIFYYELLVLIFSFCSSVLEFIGLGVYCKNHFGYLYVFVLFSSFSLITLLLISL